MEIITKLAEAMQDDGIYFVTAVLLFVIIQLCLITKYLFKRIEEKNEKCYDCQKDMQERYNEQIVKTSKIFQEVSVALELQSKVIEKILDLSYSKE